MRKMNKNELTLDTDNGRQHFLVSSFDVKIFQHLDVASSSFLTILILLMLRGEKSTMRGTL